MTEVTRATNGQAAADVKMAEPQTDLERLLEKRLRVAMEDNSLPVVDGVVVPKTAEGIYRLARWYVMSGMVPDSLRGSDAESTQAKVAIAISAGIAVGLTHTQAVASVMVVNNRPCMWGDALVAVCRRSAECVAIECADDGSASTCTAKRMRKLPDGSFHTESVVHTFSQRDAETASLTNKGPWKSNPKRMRQNRARAFALRDLFPDLLMGLSDAEEQMDVEAVQTEQRGATYTGYARAASETLVNPLVHEPATPKPAPEVPPGGLSMPPKGRADAPQSPPAAEAPTLPPAEKTPETKPTAKPKAGKGKSHNIGDPNAEPPPEWKLGDAP